MVGQTMRRLAVRNTDTEPYRIRLLTQDTVLIEASLLSCTPPIS